MAIKRNPGNPARPGNFQLPRQTLRAQILIPKDSPIRQVEIEVFAALLDDWDSLLTDNGEGTGQ